MFMSEAACEESDNGIDSLTALVRLAEMTTILTKYFNKQISKSEAAFNIYLKDMERPSSKKLV